MSANTGTSEPKGMSKLPAGDFSAWLRQMRGALANNTGVDVSCGDCTACCDSFYFIHIRPDETGTLAAIRRELLVAAPGMRKGNVLLGYDKKGVCPMLIDGTCAIYENRPHTCRNYDCRVFAATGIAPGGEEKARIAHRVQRWQFSYPTERDREEHAAVRAAARFILGHAESFPGRKIPSDPNQLAIVAIKSYAIFLHNDNAVSPADKARAIVEACRTFDDARESI